MSKAVKTFYIVKDPEHSTERCSQWLVFDSLDDAVAQGGDGSEIFEAEAKSIGAWELKAMPIPPPAAGNS